MKSLVRKAASKLTVTLAVRRETRCIVDQTGKEAGDCSHGKSKMNIENREIETLHKKTAALLLISAKAEAC